MVFGVIEFLAQMVIRQFSWSFLQNVCVCVCVFNMYIIMCIYIYCTQTLQVKLNMKQKLKILFGLPMQVRLCTQQIAPQGEPETADAVGEGQVRNADCHACQKETALLTFRGVKEEWRYNHPHPFDTDPCEACLVLAFRNPRSASRAPKRGETSPNGLSRKLHVRAIEAKARSL